MIGSISAIGATAGFFFAAAILLRDPSRSWESIYLAGAAAALGANLTQDALATTSFFDHMPWLFGWGYASILGIGPCVWLHIAALASPMGAGWARARLHAVIYGLCLVALIPYAALPGDLRWRIEQGRDLEGSEGAFDVALTMWLVVAVGTIQPLIYLIWSFLRARGVVQSDRRKWTMTLLVLSSVCWLSFAAAVPLSLMGLDVEIASTANNAIIAAALYGLALFAIAWPPDPLTVVQPVLTAPAVGKYTKSALDDVGASRLMAKLETANAERALHRDPALSLKKLAGAVGTNPNDLSQAMNTLAGGYHEWLALQRVRDAQNLLRSNPNLSLLESAFTVGFNSKSTFYEAFRRAEGMTPKQWRDSQAQNAKP